MSIAKHHAEWLSLIEVSGPFLSLPVLVQRFPQGMDAHDPEHAKALRQVYEEWDQDQNGDRPDPAIHRQWIDWVLRNTLDLGDVLVEGQKIPQTLKADLAEHGETLRPDKVVMEPGGGKARLLIQTYPLKQKLSRVVEGKPWAASPDTRMMQLLHDTGMRLGLVTNGDQWMLVDAPKGETTGYASWYASLWLEEPKTLQAFRTLLSSYRFFGVPEDETLERLLAQSAQDQQEVTDQLGYQVRQAVEVLVQTLDRANRDSGGALLKGVPEDKLYEAALTVMMRLVFLFCAEERELLLLGDELYDKNYAVSTLREQLRVTATNFGEEVLERRHDAWSRLLTTFRAVYGGVQHDRLKLPAYKGELFDPDRFPFLEGRKLGTSWKDTPSQPIPVDNRTVLHLLEALQVLQVRLPGGGPATPRKLSFRALSIIQIGHVYEGLLDHTAVKATEPVLGLSGPRDKEPEMPLSELEALAAKGEDELLAFVKDETGRSSVATVKRLLASEPDDLTLSRFRTACQGDEKLWERVKPFAGLVRLDTFDYPVVILPGSVFVTAGTDRRSSGTHYTPKSLTEPIVQYTLEPLVYVGPAEGMPRDQWRLKLGEGTARPQDLRHGVRLRGVLGPGVHLPGGTVARSLGGGREASAGLTPDHALRRGLDGAARRATDSPRPPGAADLCPPDRRPAVLVRRGQEPAGGRDGEAVALAADARQGQAVRVPGPCDPVRRFAGGAQQHRPVAPVLDDRERQGPTADGAAAAADREAAPGDDAAPQADRDAALEHAAGHRAQDEDARERRGSDEAATVCRRHAPGGDLGGEERRRVGVCTQRDAG